MATLYFVRHAKAGSRSHWQEDDRVRPLSKSGLRQAEALVTLFAPFAISTVFSSPYERCVQTVEPVARARRLAVQESRHLAEGAGLRGAYRFIENEELDDAVLCTHGDVIQELIEDLIRRRIVKAAQLELDKGSTWVIEADDGSPVSARYIPAP
jgi:broad specificity phosphatase PhoE